MKKNIYILFIFLCFFTCVTTCNAELKFTYFLNNENYDLADGMMCSFGNAFSNVTISARDYFDDSKYITFINDTVDVSVKAGTFISFRFNEVISLEKTDMKILKNGTLITSPTDEDYQKCFKKAFSGRFYVSLRDSNDVNSDIVSNVSDDAYCQIQDSIIRCSYDYSPNLVCMDKNGQIDYSEPCSDSERMFEYKFYSDPFFRYFIPLNATKETGFSISLVQIGYLDSQYIIGKDECHRLIDANLDTYRFFMVDNNGDKLSNNYDDSIARVQNGCYLKSVINIPVSQSFYTVDNTGKRTGYNFYFRKIDINNPFPSPVYSKGLWNEWREANYLYGKYDKNNVSPNIKNSFAESTYEIKGENIQKFNDLFAGKDYFEWDHILSNGHSQNITSDYFNKIPLVDSYGDLGKIK